MPRAKERNKKPSFYSLQPSELHKGNNSVSENYTAFWCLFLSTSGNLDHVVPPHKASQCTRATWQDQFKQMSDLCNFLFLVFLPCHWIPGKEIQISDALITHFFFFFSLPNSTWVKITISCSWKMGAAPTFPALINFMACPGLSPKQVQHQLHLGELQEMSGVTGVPCSRWDFWVLTTSESTEKEGEAFIYATLYVSDRLLRRSSTRTRTGLEKAGKGAQEKKSLPRVIRLYRLQYASLDIGESKWCEWSGWRMIIHYFLQNTNSGIPEASFKWKIGNSFSFHYPRR